jgi:hypothetical protein
MSNTRVNLLSPVLFYKNPVDIFQIQNGSTQVDGKSTEFKSCRGCNQNLASNDPASQYQRQKLIQNTVRVYSSLYTMNLAGLAGYQKPSSIYQLIKQVEMPYFAPPGVNWNQMSDRAKPALQTTKVASGSTYHSSSTKHSITRDRPGAMSPGGLGVDIKHNSYERRLNKLKGRAVLRRGVIPPNYGAPIPFNRAYPVYGGKVVKTAIVNNCDCPNITDNSAADKRIYGSVLNAIQDQILAVGYKFNVGDFVWAKKDIISTKLYKAQIVDIVNEVYEIKFVDDGSIEYKSASSLLIYFDCDCTFESSVEEVILANQYSARDINELTNASSLLACNILTLLAASKLL